MIKYKSVFLQFFVLVGLAAQGRDAEGPHTLYSYRATTLDAVYTHAVILTSPDQRKTLSVRAVEDPKDPDGIHLEYGITTGGKTFTANLLGFNGEVAWSPDSKAIAITQTEGGGGIGSRVYILYAAGTGMKKVDVSHTVERAFGNPVKCEVSVPPNTGFIRWGSDSSRLLVAAEIVPASLCGCAGTFRVYEVALPTASIVRAYSQTESKKLFREDLGCELRNADDKCIQVVESYARQHGDR